MNVYFSSVGVARWKVQRSEKLIDIWGARAVLNEEGLFAKLEGTSLRTC